MKQLDNSQLNTVKGGLGKRPRAHGTIYNVKAPKGNPQK